MKTLTKCIFAAASFCCCAALADMTWTGEGGDSLWSNASNWSGDSGNIYFPQGFSGSSWTAVVDEDTSYENRQLNVNCGTEEQPVVIKIEEGKTLTFTGSGDSHILINNINDTSSTSYVRIEGGGTLATPTSANHFRVGANGSGKGTLVVGTNTILNVGANAYIPWDGKVCSGELILEPGAKMTSGEVFVGKNSKGVLRVMKGAYLYSSADLTLGRNNVASGANVEEYSEAIIEGGTVSTTRFWLPYNDSGTARRARMTITDGGSYTNRSGDCNIARNTSGIGEVIVSGEGSVFYASVKAYVAAGASSQGTVTVADGGLFHENSSDGIVLANASGATATVNANSGGIVETRKFQLGNSSGSATINLNGGTLRGYSSSPTTYIPSGVAVTLGENGGTIDSNGLNLAIDADLTLADGVEKATLTKIGGGTLTINGTVASGITIKLEGGALADTENIRSANINVGAAGSLVFSSIGDITESKTLATYTNLTIANGASYYLLGKGATATVEESSVSTNAILSLDAATGAVTAALPGENDVPVAFYDGSWTPSKPNSSGWNAVILSNTGNSEFNNNNDAWTVNELILKGVTANFRQTGGSPRIVTTHIGGTGTVSLMSYGIMNISGKDLTIDEGITILARQHDDSSHRLRCFINRNGSGAITVNGTIEVHNNDASNLDNTGTSHDGSIHIETDAVLNGPVVGDGEVRFINERSPVVSGDWSRFTGTVNKTTYNNKLKFTCPQAVSPFGTYNIVGDVHYAGETGSTVSFGSLNLKKNNWCVFYVPGDIDGYECTIEVGANDKDMTFGENYFFGPESLASAAYKNRVIHLVKKGAGTLVDCSYGTHDITVEEGAILFGDRGSDSYNTACENELASITVKSGASIGGTNTRTITSLTMEDGAGIRGVLAAAEEEGGLPTAVTGELTIGNASAISLSGRSVTFSGTDTALLEAVQVAANRQKITGLFNLGNAFTGAPTEDTGIAATASESGKTKNWLAKLTGTAIDLVLNGTASGLIIILR